MSIAGLDPNSPASNGLAGLGDDEIRALKTALQACFPALEGLIEKGVGNGAPNASEFTALFDDVAALQAGSSGLIPVGAIVMWSGTVANIPTGWALCNGSTANGFVTPDLRDKFLVGAGDLADGSEFNPGNTGGNTISSGTMTTASGGDGVATGTITIPDHTLTVNNIPEHAHFTVVDTAGSTPNNGDAAGTYAINSHDGGGDAEYRMKRAASTSTEANVGLTSSWGSSGAVDPLTHTGATIDIDDISHTHDYMPAYYAVAYIAYVGTP